MRICAIESSCDETAVARHRGRKDCFIQISSHHKINVHSKFGGVIPEVASRLHIENISVVLEEALQKAGYTMDQIDAIAVTQGPWFGRIPACRFTGRPQDFGLVEWQTVDPPSIISPVISTPMPLSTRSSIRCWHWWSQAVIPSWSI